MPPIRTERLISRGWRESDLPPLGARLRDRGRAGGCAVRSDTLELPEVVSVTMAGNARSQAVMRRIGMTTDPAEDFDDPDVDDDELRRRVVYRKRRYLEN